MAPSQDAWLRTLFLRCTDASLTEEARLEAATLIARDYPYQDLVSPLTRIVLEADTPPATASFALRVLYVGMRKWPALYGYSVGSFDRIIRSKDLDAALRTQAFMHLLLLDLDTAERVAEAAMPEMLVLARSERQFPTIRRESADAAYEEATLKTLVH